VAGVASELDWDHQLVILQRSVAMLRPEQTALRAEDAERVLRDLIEVRHRMGRLLRGLQALIDEAG